MEMGRCQGIRRTVNAADVTAGSIAIQGQDLAPTGATAVVRTAAGGLKAWDGLLLVVANTVTLDNSGAVDWADTDTIDIVILSG